MNYDSQVSPSPIPTESPTSRKLSCLCTLQGAYFVFTGLWPLFDIFTFQLVTGPKLDLWLVQTVGILVTVIGGTLLLAGIRRKITLETTFLAVGTAFGLAGVDCLFVALHRISPIYLLDACAEVVLIALWVVFYYFDRTVVRPSTPLSLSASAASLRPPRVDCSFETTPDPSSSRRI